MSPDAQERVRRAAARMGRILAEDCDDDAEILSALCMLVSDVLWARHSHTDALSWIGHLCFDLIDRAEQDYRERDRRRLS